MPEGGDRLRTKLIVCLVGLVFIFSGAVSVLAEDGGPADPLRVTYSNKVCYEPFMVAEALGLFDEAGVEVEPMVMGGGSLSKEAVATRSADVGAMGDAPGLILASMDAGTRIVCSYGSGGSMHRIVVVESVKGVDGLMGARVGVQAGSSSHGALLTWIEVNGLRSDDLQLVYMRPPDMVNAMATGQLDAMMASEPWPTLALDSVVGARVIGDSSVCGNTFPLLICATERVLAERPDDIRAMMSALAEAIDIIRDDPAAAAALCAPLTGLDARSQLDCMSRLGYGLHDLDDEDIGSLVVTADFLVGNGILGRVPDMGTISVGGWVAT